MLVHAATAQFKPYQSHEELQHAGLEYARLRSVSTQLIQHRSSCRPCAVVAAAVAAVTTHLMLSLNNRNNHPLSLAACTLPTVQVMQQQVPTTSIDTMYKS